MEEEQLRLLEEARQAEQERLRQAIEVTAFIHLYDWCLLLHPSQRTTSVVWF